jgi:hypothetical protein
MTIRSADPDPSAISRIHNRLVELIGEADFAERRPKWPLPGTLELTLPHVVYGLAAEQLAAHVPLAQAQPVATRVLVRIDGALVASAELGLIDEAEVTVTDGPFVPSTVRALELLEAVAAQRDGELRVLRSSSLRLMAAWLHADDGDDRFVPLAPAPDDLAQVRSLSGDEAAERFAALAQRYLDMPVVLET